MDIRKPLNPRIDNFSPIREGVNQTYLGRDTYYTRETGRTGNTIFEYVYWRLRAKQDGKAFECTYPNFYYSKADKYVPKTDIEDKQIKSVKEYPFSLEYYKNHREEIREFLHYEDTSLKYDTVIHLRLDDILNDCMAYTLLPFSNYIELFKEIKNDVNDITIIGRAVDGMQEEYTECLRRSLEALMPDKKITISLNNSVKEDFDIISSCKTLVASTSVFWFWSSFLSNNVEKVFYPNWGVCKQMCLENDDTGKYIPFANNLHPIKIKKETLHRIFL